MDKVSKYKIYIGKSLFVIKNYIQKYMIEHIHDAKDPKEAWNASSAYSHMPTMHGCSSLRMKLA